MPCCEWMGGPPWLSLSGKSDHVLRETWERQMQRTRRLVVDESQPRATVRIFVGFRALPIPLCVCMIPTCSLLPSEHRQTQPEAAGKPGSPGSSQLL